MTAYYFTDITILCGHVREVLARLTSDSIHCVVTSPPYWKLRDYGHPDQLGMEATPDEFVDNLATVFDDIKRVLRPDGTAWVNLGDTYSQDSKWGGTSNKGRRTESYPRGKFRTGLPDKSLVMIPHRFALECQRRGWIIRNDIVWHKPNADPDSAADRCGKAHEYIFLMAKSGQYHFDGKAIEEKAKYAGQPRGGSKNRYEKRNYGKDCKVYDTRKKRTVWTVQSEPYYRDPDDGATNYATYPARLIEPCILAGCPVGGTVLDPFGGTGTTAIVAYRHHRKAVLIELSERTAKAARRRISDEIDKTLLFDDPTPTTEELPPCESNSE